MIFSSKGHLNVISLVSKRNFLYNSALTSWKGGRVVECSSLENCRRASVRGFESHPFRQSHRTKRFCVWLFFIFFYFFSVILLSISIELPKSQVSFVLFAFISLFLILIIPNAGF